MEMKGFTKCENGHYYKEELASCPYCRDGQRPTEASNPKGETQLYTEQKDGNKTRIVLPKTPEQQSNRTVFGDEVKGEIDGREVVQSEYRSSSVGIEMIAVEGGTFLMGAQKTDPNAPNYDADAQDNKWNSESPVHKVTLSDYFIGKYPVTQAQWKAVMGNNPSFFVGDNLPVEQVSWNDVQDFIRKLNQKTGKNYRLPTEAEWEFAARGGNQSRDYKYSGSNTDDNVAWCNANSDRKTHPVGTKQANELGIYDMSGNVWEWCSDWYGDYSSDSQTNPRGASTGSNRVLRGGSWYNIAWYYVRVSYRIYFRPDIRLNDLGFRLALSSN
ncbi:MAG: formylglycine-generating enzyme family protein [Dysgonamonadaceae bacterium]|jgi:formylglycine-generating enzyme required for sulfatase activity|nr:formylglycine-generating enzyme family protein [Dysgonamonadaceae bacterium]